MSIGRVTVDLLARTGSFESDLNRAAKHAQRRAKEIDEAVSKAGIAVGAALSAAGIAAVYFGKQLIDGLDALNDFKDATGASIENLSALEDVAVRTGTNMDNVSSILVKFNKELQDVDGENEASQVLKKLGLDAEELKRIDPAEALRQTAVAFQKFATDGDYARAIQILFGKSVKEAAPYLKDLAEKTELVGKVTAEQAENAEIFNKQIFAMQANAADAGRAFLKDLLPALTEVLNYTKNAEGETNLLAIALGGIRTVFETLVVVSSDVAFVLKGVGNEIGGIAAQIGALLRLDFKGFSAIGDAMKEDATRARSELDLFQFKILNPGARVIPTATPDRRPSMGGIAAAKKEPKAKKPPADKDTELEKYLENLQKQLEKTRDLGVAETVLADIQSGRLKLQKGESAEPLLAIARQIDEVKSLAEYTKLAEAADKTRADALLQSTLDQEAQAKGLAEGNKSLKEETELIGKSIEAQAAIQSARISSAIAIKEEELARLLNTDSYARETDAIREQIRLLTERKDLVVTKGVAEKLADEAKKTEDFARAVGAAFESSFEKAILEGGKLGDVLKGLAEDILKLTIRQTITGPMSSAISSSLGGAFGGLFGGVVQDSAGFEALISGLQYRAAGGPVSRGKSYMVGEMGPEMFTPNTAGAITPNSALGGGQHMNVTINNTVGDVASLSQVRQAQAGTERRIGGMIARSQRYGGALA